MGGQPELLETAQRLTLEIDGTEIETLDLASEAPIFHRIDVPAESLGDGATVVLTLNVEDTFVPAELTGNENRDPRELGAQVFYAFLDSEGRFGTYADGWHGVESGVSRDWRVDQEIGRPSPSRIRGPLRRCIWRWPGARSSSRAHNG